ncbi:hypothetical protein CMUS01_13003 [Colletotrichum musicola]|uniref:DUF7708 domain-containing protein n=1 Tax=Colletotrichum musicola TaxID=2175873 RepID=A0A8H6JGD7_9PEZI|nr:hypothetical protein CMUS01_13003 [Colletotrichum musicola]
MQRKPTLNTVVFRTPSWSRVDGSPTSVSSPVIPWNPRDEVIRRFSDPAKEDDIQAAGSTYESAETSYARAVKSLQVLLQDEGALPAKSGKQELYQIAKKIQDAKEGVLDKSKMQKFVKSLDHYQGVFDILSQADFSGLPLIWGGLKLMLLMSKNSSEVLSKVLDVVIDIGRSLERIRAYTKLYPIPRIVEFTTELYDAIVEFLEKVIKDSKKSTFKRAMSDFLQPFDVRYGDLLAKMRNIQVHITEDANVCLHVRQAMTSHSISKYQTLLPLQRLQMHQSYKGWSAACSRRPELTFPAMAEDPSASLFQAIRKSLFHGFEVEAGYHQELESTYKTTTSKAWVEWFKMEQRYVPSGYSHETRVIQAECDAPDPQHALVWKKQQRTLASHVPSAYLIWTRGMTAQSAIASLVDQILFQKTEVMADAGLDLEQFREANNSPRALWNFFLYLATVLGGCMVYVTIGSVGDEEAAVVGKFVSMAKSWKGPAINVTLIHPFGEQFSRVDDVVNLDDKYDVHPSLTTTDAMHHVLALEIGRSRRVSDTIQSLLWETAWREVRYAVIGIALAQVIDRIHLAAKIVAQHAKDKEPEGRTKAFSETDAEHWVASVSKWTANKWSMDTLREQIQRHIDIVDIHLPPEIKRRLKKKLEHLMLAEEGEFGARQLSEAQRSAIWDDLQEAIRPGTRRMFCGRVEELLAAVLDDYRQQGPEGEGQSKTLFLYLVKEYFGKSGRWKDTFSEDAGLVADGITEAIEIGFRGLVKALAGPGM